MAEDKIIRTEEEWKKILTPEEYRVLREKGTEPPGSGELYHNTEHGTYVCRACGTDLFKSDAKYDSGSGWPSFRHPVVEAALRTEVDTSCGMARTEVLCRNCDAHLGHVFSDGPPPGGLRYCINSVSLELEEHGGQ